MSKTRIEPPPPKLASDSERQEAAAVIVKAWVAMRGQNNLADDIPIVAAAMTLALHELAPKLVRLTCRCGFKGSPWQFESAATDDNCSPIVLCPRCYSWLNTETGEMVAEEEMAVMSPELDEPIETSRQRNMFDAIEST